MSEKKTTPEKVTIESVLGKERLDRALSQPRAGAATLEQATQIGAARHPDNPEAAACAGAMLLLQSVGSRPELALLKRYAAAFPGAGPEVARREQMAKAREALRKLAAE